MPNDLDAMRIEFLDAIQKVNGDHLHVLDNAEAIPTAQYFKSKEWMGKILKGPFNPYLLDQSSMSFKVTFANEATQPYDMIWCIHEGPVDYSVVESSYYIVVISRETEESGSHQALTEYINSLLAFNKQQSLTQADASGGGDVFSTNGKAALKDLRTWSDRVDVVRKNGNIYTMIHKVDLTSELEHPSKWFKTYFKEKF